MNQSEPSKKNGYSSLHLILAITPLLRLQQLNGTTIPHDLSQSVRNYTQRHRMYLHCTGILTCFPFDQLDLQLTLGSTNPWLTNIAKDP